MMDEISARAELRKIRYARDEQLISAHVAAERAAAVLDRSPLEPVDLTRFLIDKGHHGADLNRLMGRFAPAVRDEYVAEWGVPPLKRVDLTDVGRRPVNAYVVDDLPLIERAYVKVTSSAGVVS